MSENKTTAASEEEAKASVPEKPKDLSEKDLDQVTGGFGPVDGHTLPYGPIDGFK